LGLLAEPVERVAELRVSLFKNLRYMGYGGVTLSNDINDRIQALAIAETGLRIPLTTMYGATETQSAAVVHWPPPRLTSRTRRSPARTSLSPPP
jgi:feruloyl-CoA synthase